VLCATHIIFDASLELQQVCEVVFRCDEVHLRARRNKANNNNDDTESPVSQNELCQQRHHHHNNDNVSSQWSETDTTSAHTNVMAKAHTSRQPIVLISSVLRCAHRYFQKEEGIEWARQCACERGVCE
jgi:viroplasmin and RNaseH domain-containing protein